MFNPLPSDKHIEANHYPDKDSEKKRPPEDWTEPSEQMYFCIERAFAVIKQFQARFVIRGKPWWQVSPEELFSTRFRELRTSIHRKSSG